MLIYYKLSQIVVFHNLQGGGETGTRLIFRRNLFHKKGTSITRQLLQTSACVTTQKPWSIWDTQIGLILTGENGLAATSVLNRIWLYGLKAALEANKKKCKCKILNFIIVIKIIQHSKPDSSSGYYYRATSSPTGNQQFSDDNVMSQLNQISLSTFQLHKHPIHPIIILIVTSVCSYSSLISDSPPALNSLSYCMWVWLAGSSLFL